MRTVAVAVLASLVGVACTGEIEEGCQIDGSPPAAPSIEPVAHDGFGVVQTGMVFTSTAFYDEDVEDNHRATEYEVWRFAGGSPVVRVWHAGGGGGINLTQVTLADGTFDIGNRLEEFTVYGTRARHQDDSIGCEKWGEWGDYAVFRTADGSASWFDQTVVNDVYIDLSPESYALIDAEAQPPGCVKFERSYYSGTLRYDGQTYEGVGVRAKGGCGSARSLDDKPGMKVSLAWDDPAIEGCAEKRRINGLERITLNSMNQDPSFIREMLSYRFFRAMGVPVPRTSYARLILNDEPKGVHLHVETIDRRYLGHRYGSKEGMLYEGIYYCDLVPGNIPDTPDGETCFDRKFETDLCDDDVPERDPTDFSLLAGFTEAIGLLGAGEFNSRIERFFDLETYLSMWAVEAIVSHWDGYTYQVINNYRVYHDPSRLLWSIIPTGMDQTWGRGPTVDFWNPSGIVARRCMADDACRSRFKARVEEAVAVLENLDMVTYADDLESFVQDNFFDGQTGGFEGEVQAVRDFLETRPDQIRSLLAADPY